jgi:hypothetical protein
MQLLVHRLHRGRRYVEVHSLTERDSLGGAISRQTVELSSEPVGPDAGLLLGSLHGASARGVAAQTMEQLDGLLKGIADSADGLEAPNAGGEETETQLTKLRAAQQQAAEAAKASAEAQAAVAAEEKRHQLELTVDWACESCMTVDNSPKDARCRVCSAWRSASHRAAFEAEAARVEAELVAEAARVVAEREAEEAARLASLQEKLSMTRDERVAAMLGRLANRRMYDVFTVWIVHVEAARVKRQGEDMHAAHYRLGKRCKVASAEELRATLHERYVHLESGAAGAQLDPESLLATWRGKAATYEPLCGSHGVIVAVSAEDRAVELQFAANLHQGSGDVSAFWLPIEVCGVEGFEDLPTPVAAGPKPAGTAVKRRSAEPEPEPEPEQRRYERDAEQDERSWAEQQQKLAQDQASAAVVIQARWRGFYARKLHGPELERTRGWTEHDHLMETINRLERGTRANFNLQFPNARRESEDPAIAAVREEWQAAIGDGPHWSTKMIAYHIAGALDEDLALVLSGDAIYPDGIVRRRLSPEDAERVLSAVQVEVRRRQRLGLAGSRAIAALAALDDDEDGSVEKKKEQRREPLEGEYEERHLEETVKQCIEDLILELELADNPNVVSDRAMDHWSRTRTVADRIAAAASAKALGEAGAWFQPEATRWMASLTLDKLRLTDLGGGVIAAALPTSNLRTLVLHECGLGSEGVIAIAGVLHRCPALELLDLHGNAALNAGLRAVAAGVTHPGCGLRGAFLSFNMTAKEWSSRGLEDAIRCLHSVIPHSRLTSLKLDFRYEVISRARPFRQQKMLKLHVADFAARQGAPLPDWLQVGGSGAPKHGVTDEMRARLWANLRRASHAARQRLAWAVVAQRVPVLAVLGNVLHERLRLAVAERTRRDACTTATGGMAAHVATGQHIPLAHHYTTQRKVLAREGIEADSRPLRFLEEGEIVAGLEVKCDRRSGGEPRLRFIYASPPMVGVQGWASLSASLPPGPTKNEVEAAAAAATEAAKKRRAATEAAVKEEEERWKQEMVTLEKAVEDARQLPLGDDMLAALLAAEKAMLAADKQHTVLAAALESELAAPPPKPLALPSHRSWQMGQLENDQTGGDTMAIRRALNVEGDLLTPLPGCEPVPGDGRETIRKQRRRQRQLACTTGLAEAMVEHRNTLPPEDYGDTQADFLFVVAADGRWPVHTSRRVHLLSYTEDSKVKFHSRLRIVAATCPAVEQRAGPTLPVPYRPIAEKRQEALFAEAPRWQSQSTVQELSKWLLDESGLLWPAGWACVRVADVLSVVEAEGELVEEHAALSELRARLTLLRDTTAVLDSQLVTAVEALEVVEHTHELASIEAKYYDGTKLDGTQGESSPTTVLVTATEKLRGAEEDRARQHSQRLETEREDAQVSAAATEADIQQREKRVSVLNQALGSCAVSDSVALDWEKTLVESHADEKPLTLAERWAQEEREQEEDDDPDGSEAADSSAAESDVSDAPERLASLTDDQQALLLTDGMDMSTQSEEREERRRRNRARKRNKKKKKKKQKPMDAGSAAAAAVHTPADFQHGEGGLLGEALSLRASRLDARLPALQRHTELLPLPISSHHVHRSPPPFGTPGGAQRRPRRLSASPIRMLAPLPAAAADSPAAMMATASPVRDGSVAGLDGATTLSLAPMTPEQPARRHIVNSSPLFGRGG